VKRIRHCIAAIFLLSAVSQLNAAGPELQPRLASDSDTGRWFSMEYLYWFGKGQGSHVLATASPLGTPQAQAGILSSATTTSLYRVGDATDGAASGARLRFGFWSDSAHTHGWEGSVFGIVNNNAAFAASAGDYPILARPFLNTATGQQDALLLTYPGLTSGRIDIRETSRPMGVDLVLHKEICSACSTGRIYGLIGYRYLRLAENLDITTHQLALSPIIVAGFTFDATDRFATTNNFHGLDLGLKGDVVKGPWMLTWQTKVAIGMAFSKAQINGATTITPALGSSSTQAGGLLAQPSNIGTYRKDRLALAPELAAHLSYRINPNARVFAGYHLTYLNNIVRPEDVIDNTINLSQPGTPARPSYIARTSDYWMQGINAGIAFDF
jgi:hypothetical protein